MGADVWRNFVSTSLELPCAAAASGRRGTRRRTRNLPSSDGDPYDDVGVAVLQTVPVRGRFFLPAVKSFSQGCGLGLGHVRVLI